MTLRPFIDSARIGVHLQLTSGIPVIAKGGATLVDPGAGRFRPKTDFAAMDPQEVHSEWTAQIELFRKMYGHLPSHIDSHHGPHREPHLLPVYAELARTYGVPARAGGVDVSKFLADRGVVHCEVVFDGWTGSRSTAAGFLEGISRLSRDNPAARIEAISHPGFVDRELQSVSSLNTARGHEMVELYSIDATDLRSIGAAMVHYTAPDA
jgi:chitin disaccharide deacetylase